jgi:hypothetical protein
VYPHIVARQRLGKDINVATNTHATIRNYLTHSFLCGAYRIKGNLATSSSQEETFPLPVFLVRTFWEDEVGADRLMDAWPLYIWTYRFTTRRIKTQISYLSVKKKIGKNILVTGRVGP